MQDKIRGGIFGAALGDAVGLTYEGCFGDESRVPDIRGGGQFNLSCGAVTDDTLMTLALIETWNECGCFERETFLKKMTLTVRENPVTFGRTTKTLVSFVEMGMQPEFAAKCVDMIFGSRTNGSAMRTLPVGLALADPRSEAARVSAFSHIDRAACEACSVISSAASALLRGVSKEDVLSHVPAKYLEGDLIPSVDAEESVRCAFVCFRDGVDYIDTVRRAICLGGDTDTIACIAGGLAGIACGYEALPKDWIDKLLLREKIEKDAGEFMSARCAARQV